ncbi:GGDEF domain-containing protein [Desulfobacter curvatus]|uniref:GGDEF domain-containing protein n=1 Tax=Desulfobacter curvatus TaxID=2290 RepID=UPI000374F725|nr:diguanylate cyclase [Desulfobacter curvatus]
MIKKKLHINLASLVFVFLIFIGAVPILIFFLLTQQKVVAELTALEEEQQLNHFQNDLDQLKSKIKSYENMIGFVSQLPAALEILDHGSSLSGAIDKTIARQRYQGVLSRAFRMYNEVINIHILDMDLQVRFSLIKDPDTRQYRYATVKKFDVMPSLLEQTARMSEKDFYLSPLIAQNRDDGNGHKLIFRILTPIFFKGKKVGIFCSDIDINILTATGHEIHWVCGNGEYLSLQKIRKNGFDTFPKLEALFQKGEPGIWKEGPTHMVWVPVFKGGNCPLFLWAGKEITLHIVQTTIHNIMMNALKVFLALLLVLSLISLVFARGVKTYSAQFLGKLKQSIIQKQNTFPGAKGWIREFHAFFENLSLILEQNKKLESERQQTLYLLEQKETQLLDANRRLEEMASLDALTGIPNRRIFDDYIKKIWGLQARSKNELSVIFCDIDYFKKYNDIYGHPSGDKCLKLIAKCLESTVKRSGDLIARYGGEEFLVVLAETKSENALFVAQSLRDAVEQLRLPHSGSLVSNHVTLSIGVASAIPNTKVSHEVLIKHADMALYQAKEEGRNRIVMYHNLSQSR